MARSAASINPQLMDPFITLTGANTYQHGEATGA